VWNKIIFDVDICNDDLIYPLVQVKFEDKGHRLKFKQVKDIVRVVDVKLSDEFLITRQSHYMRYMLKYLRILTYL